MRPSLFRLQSVGINGAKSTSGMGKGIPSQKVPFYASKKNVAINCVITFLYGYGLYAFYKDYQTAKRFAVRKLSKPDPDVSPYYLERVEDIHNAPNRLFHSEHEDKEVERSTMRRVIHSLTYGDVSQCAVAWGFLIQLCNTTHAVYGTKSMLFRTSLLSVVGFPPLLYYLYRMRLFNLEKKGVIIN
ncbi:hypothetical protein HG536_0B03530 [Torulaspora globosa]|uniref:Uncharacterized protein n=1 Tax=Torulaspora globosa TaxID=48254 RepID=A0A7G3ZDA4_9SACH|nr:uncharacterized protein HG536_0B03530 [Torulaspora globosa]QLL31490.1 hypothetical protein HG536_0B03530 [Torulaspora globosa]